MAWAAHISLLITLAILLRYTMCNNTQSYIVHIDLSVMPSTHSDPHSWYMSTLSSISETKFQKWKMLYTYENVMNGFAAVISPSELEALKNTSGFLHATLDRPAKMDTTHSPQFLGLNTNWGAWPSAELGSEVIIGFLDTGIWPESKSFSDHGMTKIPKKWKGKCESSATFNSSTACNKKLIGARVFSKGAAAMFPHLLPSEENTPRDEDGHGTHTSSTAAGNHVENASYFGYAVGNATGVAPHARIAMYKLGFGDTRMGSDVIAAVDQAVADGVDVLSLSIGFGGQTFLYDDPIALATFGAVEKGVFVAASAGNDGAEYGVLHNGTPWLLTVAAGTVDRRFEGVLVLGNGISVTGLALFHGKLTSAQASSTLLLLGNCSDTEKMISIREKIITCDDKDIPIEFQIENAETTGVRGAVFITKHFHELEDTIITTFPAIFVDRERGKVILNYINNTSHPYATMHFKRTVINTRPAPMVASFTSRGPSRASPFVLKPDIMAPGEMILASWPNNIPTTFSSSSSSSNPLPFSHFNVVSGTSMACPHAAGVAALLRSAHPEWSPAAVRSAMMTTAYVVDNQNMPIRYIRGNRLVDGPLAMGSGHVNPNKAMNPGLVYDAHIGDYINLLCAMNYTSKQIHAISRSRGGESCQSPSLDLNYPSFIAFFKRNESDTVKRFSRTLTNVGAEESGYRVEVEAPDGLHVMVSPEALEFEKKYEKKKFTVTVEADEGVMEKDNVVFGSLTWVDIEGKHVVRSAMVFTSVIV